MRAVRIRTGDVTPLQCPGQPGPAASRKSNPSGSTKPEGRPAAPVGAIDQWGNTVVLRLGKSKRAIALAAAVLAMAGGATIGLTGTANAAYSSPPASTTDWFGLDLVNDPGLRHFEVCNDQSSANTVKIGVEDITQNGAVELLQDTVTGNQTYGGWVRFNPGGCEGWSIVSNNAGDTLSGNINPGNHIYSTGPVRYN